jgi:hypothetical protein
MHIDELSNNKLKWSTEYASAIGYITPYSVVIEWIQTRTEEKRKGYGYNLLSQIAQHYGLILEPVNIVSSAKQFWNRMANAKLCVIFKSI